MGKHHNKGLHSSRMKYAQTVNVHTTVALPQRQTNTQLDNDVGRRHTPSIAFRHLPPNSARFSYATEGALFISAYLTVQRRGQRPPKGSDTNTTVEAT